MNLWVNRLRQLSLLAVALFFFACEDDSSLLGFKNPNSKFSGSFVDIPLSTSVILKDNIRTSNGFYATEYNRLLVGSYDDPKIGKVASDAYAQFFTSSYDTLPDDAVLEGAYLYLQLDRYAYGATGEFHLSVYDATETMALDSASRFLMTNGTPIVYDELVADTIFSVNPALYYEQIEANTDSDKANDVGPIILKITLSTAYTDSLWASARRLGTGDTTFITQELFNEKFPGLAIVGSDPNNASVIGISTASPSRVAIRYSAGGKTGLERTLFFYPQLASYNNIRITDPEDLSFPGGLQPGQDYELDGTRYVQSGTGLLTQLKLDSFYDYIAEHNLSDITINSAQLIIGGVEEDRFGIKPEDPLAVTVPPALALRPIDNENYFLRADLNSRTLAQHWSRALAPDLFLTNGGRTIQEPVSDNDRSWHAITDAGNLYALRYSSENNQYSGFLTLFFQRLFENRGDQDRIVDFALFPVQPNVPGASAKSVNRVVFPAENVHVRIFYTTPTVTKD